MQQPTPQPRQKLRHFMLARYAFQADTGDIETMVLCPMCYRIYVPEGEKYIFRHLIPGYACCNYCAACNLDANTDTDPIPF